MRNVDFEFTKNWGLIKKGTVKNLDRAFARELQDKRKVGKIKELKPTQDKSLKGIATK